jgi:hypothetical protein
LVSRRRGRPSTCRIARAEERRIVSLARRHYSDFRPTFATESLYAYVLRYGRPAASCGDRHSIFTKHRPEDPVPTPLERAVRSLDIPPILGWTPQAKDRVERAFQTLQDRLVMALRHRDQPLTLFDWGTFLFSRSGVISIWH